MSDRFPAPPPPPDPALVTQWTQWLGQIRGVLILAGGIGLGGTWLKPITGLTDAELSGYVAAVVSVVSVAAWAGPAAWSWIEKKRTAWAVAKALRLAAVAAAVASAEQTAKATHDAGRPVLVPVTVIVTPGDQPNEAVRIRASEQEAAPGVPIGVTPSPAPRPAA